jgi:hypothetical protein
MELRLAIRCELLVRGTRKGQLLHRQVHKSGMGTDMMRRTGGTQPLWTRTGEELSYVSLDGELMRAPVEPNRRGGQGWQARSRVSPPAVHIMVLA